MVALLTVLAGCSTAPKPTPADGSATLTRLLDAAHEQTIRGSISDQLRYGRPIERLPGLSLADEEAKARVAQALLDTLATVPRASLSEAEQISADVLEWLLQGEVEAPKYHWLSLASITPYQSPLTSSLLMLGRDMPLDTPEARVRYLARLGDIAQFADSIQSGLAARAEKGIRVPKPEIKQIVGTLGGLTAAGTKSPYAPSAARITAVPDSARAAFSAAVSKTVDDGINPALGRLVAYLSGDYAKAAPDAVGLSQYQGGEAYYRFLVSRNTTLDRKPEDIHQTGLAYLARLEASMDSLLKVIGFKGSRKDFLAVVANDPRFRAKTPEDVGARYQKYYEAIQPLVSKLFSRTPKAPAEFRRLNPALEGSQTYGFYQAPSPASPVGIYFYNASNLPKRSLFSVANIAYHELVPGHHFQIALARENTDLPPLRRDFNTTAYAEGWAEYASSLGDELGLFADPYDAYGRLISEAFLTTRLIVDPGMNLLGWSRDSAMSFMREHTMTAETEIASESLRYSVDLPAQALGYKMGAMEFWRLRRRAEQDLGARFDIRAFHAMILDAGGLPMTVVGAMVDRWIATTASAAAQERVALNLVTHSVVTINRPAAAIWPLIVDPSGWKKGATLRHQSGPAGQAGEVFAAMEPGDGAKVAFWVENVELMPNQRRTIKLYAPTGSLIGYATWSIRAAGGRTVVGYDVYSETLIDPAQAKSMTPAQIREAERTSAAPNQKRFDQELLALKALVEKGR